MLLSPVSCSSLIPCCLPNTQHHDAQVSTLNVEFPNLIFDGLPPQLPPLPPFPMKWCTYYGLYNTIMMYDDEFMNCQDEFANLSELTPVSSLNEQAEDCEFVD